MLYFKHRAKEPNLFYFPLKGNHVILLGKIYAGILQTVMSQGLESSEIENLLKSIITELQR